MQACVAESYVPETFYYANNISDRSKKRVEQMKNRFLNSLDAKKYSYAKKLELHDTLIERIDDKMYETYTMPLKMRDTLEYFQNEIRNSKTLMQARKYCMQEQTKVTPTSTQKQEAEAMVLEMQENMVNMIEENLELIIDEIEKNLQVEETGDLSVDMKLDFANTKVDADVDLNDYTAIQDGLMDSQIKGKLFSFIEVQDM